MIHPACSTLLDRLITRQAHVGIIGLGYVGLPLARAIQRSGFPVVGFDTDINKVQSLQAGQSYIQTISNDDVRQMRASRFAATHDFDQLREQDAIIICVPTPLTPAREPDLSYITRSSREIAQRIRGGQLIVLESTTYPTTTRTVVLPLLEESGLKCGLDFLLAYSPEREDPGSRTHSISQLPKVVGGMDPVSLQAACELYRGVAAEVIPVSSPEIAEATKILENTYRAVNIALVNELKILYDSMGIDIWEVIAAARTKPFGFQAFTPGPGLGGHCIPIDPFYLTWLARQHGQSTRFIELAGEINTRMPLFVLGKLIDALNAERKPLSNSRILLIGMAYKKNVDDPRESPGFELMHLLQERGAIVEYHDPHIPVLPRMRKYSFEKMHSVELTAFTVSRQDAVLIVTDHDLIDWQLLANHSRLILDTRNAMAGLNGPARIVKA
ncbi:nucleotide sugar dehydrogenase [Telmatocola sphagniphila]|uniref:Nucleotide sugar dehydrogenase n=1 Tax=Telmatocola sphagniphila TaxID=1123043 RepID=A0A8E6BBD6_9BACT|nr:nucleotide sugar dehydrogenase [Telmatocola sphagniphila]QVL34626.1 nucleotide sugar dehydrogenase [Telmatocola sphagniphila]